MKYNPEHLNVAYGGGGGLDLKLGRGTSVKVTGVETLPRPNVHNTSIEQTTLIRIQMEFEAEVIIYGGRCEICHAKTPEPDARALLYMLQNHEHGRLCFPRQEHVEQERGQWPVTGWEWTSDWLTCGDCSEALIEARVAVREARRKK